jgi:hypothetical protein
MLVEVNYLKDQVGPIHACAYKSIHIHATHMSGINGPHIIFYIILGYPII